MNSGITLHQHISTSHRDGGGGGGGGYIYFVEVLCISHSLGVRTNSSMANFYPPTDRFGGHSDEPSVRRLSVRKHFRVRFVT